MTAVTEQAAIERRLARASATQPIWMERTSAPLRAARFVLLAVVTISVIVPFISAVSTSFASDQDIISAGGYVLLPHHPNLNAYRTVLQNGVVVHALLISVGITVVGTALSLVLTAAMAYGLSRPGLGLKPVLMLVLFSMIFTPGIIPSYLVVKQLGMLDSYAALILPTAINAFNLIVMRQFFMEIPEDLMNSARIDGAGDLRTLWYIVLPLSKPVIAVVGLFYAVSYWNAYFSALLYLNNQDSWPLPLVVRLFVLQGAYTGGGAYVGGNTPSVPQSLQMAVVVIATIPILLVYPFLQRYFTAGMLSGAIKG